jgi:hypothetical protein
MYAEATKIFDFAGIHLNFYAFQGHPPDIPSGFLKRENLIDLCYFGLMHETELYLHRLSRELPEWILALKTKAAHKTLFRAQHYLGGAIHYVQRHVNTLQNTISSYNRRLGLKDCRAVHLRGNLLFVHVEAIKRLATLGPNYLSNLLGGQWRDANSQINLPEEFSWAAVVEFFGWLYGATALENVPASCKRPFMQVADYICTGLAVPDSFEPLAPSKV